MSGKTESKGLDAEHTEYDDAPCYYMDASRMEWVKVPMEGPRAREVSEEYKDKAEILRLLTGGVLPPTFLRPTGAGMSATEAAMAARFATPVPKANSEAAHGTHDGEEEKEGGGGD
jgi:hypothetical protein